MVDICTSSGFLQALYILKNIFKIVCLIVPIILIFTITMDAYKLISNPGDIKKVMPVVSKRLIAALIILFIPAIVNLTLNALGQSNDVSACWNNANPDYIEAARNREKSNRNNRNTTNSNEATIVY